MTARHVPLISLSNLAEKLKWYLGHGTLMVPLNLTEKPNLCTGIVMFSRVTLASTLNLAGNARADRTTDELKIVLD